MSQQIDYFNNHIKDFLEDTVQVNKETNLLKILYADIVANDISDLVDSDPATINTKLYKKDLFDFNNLIVNLVNFFDNAAVTQANYRTTLTVVQNGNATPQAQVVSNATENYGDRIYQLSYVMQKMEESALRIKRAHTDIYMKECIDAVMAVNPTAIVPGTSSTAAALSVGITLMTDMVDFFSNQPIVTKDRKIILNNWVPRYL